MTDVAGRVRLICLALPEVAEVLEDAYRAVAPARLLRRLDAEQP